MWRATQLTIAEICNQPRCPSREEWIKKMCIYIDNGVLLSRKEEWLYDICQHVDGHAKWSKPFQRPQRSNVFSERWTLTHNKRSGERRIEMCRLDNGNEEKGWGGVSKGKSME